ncbi:MAG: transglycosylase SLT domain-containing protein [Burkholderiales bacterium]
MTKRSLLSTSLQAVVFALGIGVLAKPSLAGNQLYEPLAASVRAAMAHAVSDGSSTRLQFDDPAEGYRWLAEMSMRLERRIPDDKFRVELLKTVQYEATRAGLDPQMVLGLIQVESGFKKYAVSSAGARGLMQVMPFWVGVIGEPGHTLFDMRLNIRYGCVLMRHYLDIERGNLYRALGRYNGSLGRPEYPNLLMAAWKQWQYSRTNVAAAPPPASAPAAHSSAVREPVSNASILIVPSRVESVLQ